MSLGLDLRGGVHFMYEVDMPAAIEQTLQRLAQDVRSQLRRERIQYQSVAVRGDAVEVLLRPGASVDAARKVVKGDDPGITLTENQMDGATQLIATLAPERIKQRQDLAIEQNVTTLRNRIDELGVSE